MTITSSPHVDSASEGSGSGLVSDDEDYDEGSGDFGFEDSTTTVPTSSASTTTTTISTMTATTIAATTERATTTTTTTTTAIPKRPRTTSASTQHQGSGHHTFITDDEDLIEGSGLDIDEEEGGSGREVVGSGERAEPDRPNPPVELDPYEQQRIRTEFYELHHADMYRLDQ